MRFTSKFFISALLSRLLGGAAAYAVEFEVLDRLSVDGYTVLRGSADIPGGSFAVGGSTFVVKSGKVGIGTTAPGRPLVVYGPTDALSPAVLIKGGYPGYSGSSAALLSLQDKDNSSDFLTIGSDYSINFNRFTSLGVSARVLTIAGAGNVGIGTTAPAYNLDVSGTLNATTVYQGGSALASLYAPLSGGGNYVQLQAATPGAQQAGHLNISGTGLFGGKVGIGTTSPAYGLEIINPAGAHLSTTATAGYGLYLNTAGNVGIGTASPNSKLNIQTGTQWSGLTLTNAGGSTVGYLVGTSATNDNGQLALNSGGVNQVSIQASGSSYFNGGNVGIGTGAPDTKLLVSGSDETVVLAVENTQAPTISKFPNVQVRNYGLGHGHMSQYNAGGTKAAPTALTATTFAAWIGYGYNGTAFLESGRISYAAEDTFAAGYNPVSFIFYVGNGAGTTTERMRIKSNGNIGLGTAAPDQKLTVNGSISQTGVFISSGTGNNYFAGNVGIGTTGPAAVLDIAVAGNRTDVYLEGNLPDADQSALGVLWFRDPLRSGSAEKRVAAVSAIRDGATALARGGALIFSTNQDNTTGIYERMRVTNTGNVGIGTTNPAYGLEVIDSAGAHLSTTATAGYGLYLNSAGNVGIGTAAPDAKLQIHTSALYPGDVVGQVPVIEAVGNGQSATSQTLLRFYRPTVNGQYYGATADFNLYAYTTGTAPKTQLDIALKSGANQTKTADVTVMSLKASGNVGIGTTAPAARLDVRSGSYASNQNFGIQLGVPTGQWLSSLRIKSDGSGVPRTTIDATDGTTNGTANEALSIGATGNVGIGTTAPGQALYVGAGNIGLDGSQKIIFSDNDTSNNLKLQLWTSYGLGINGSTLFYAANGNHSWRDANGTNERMLLTTAAGGGLTVKGTGDSSFAGNLQVNGAVKVFGAWTALTLGTTYLADTDGFVVVVVVTHGNTYDLRGYTGTANPPVNLRGRAGGIGTSGVDYEHLSSFCMPVRKGEYYLVKVNSGSGTCTAEWIPLGANK